MFQQQQVRAHVQPFRYALDIIDRDIALAPLDAAKISPVHLDIIGKILLADAQLLAETANIRGYDPAQTSGMGAFHPS